ncbi:N-acetylmuramoyl-L-alanine amidase family protein [Cupriavidus basilensis]
MTASAVFPHNSRSISIPEFHLRSASFLVTAALLNLSSMATGSTIALDVGHSRARPGALSASGVGEFAFNLALATDVTRSLRGVAIKRVGFDGQMRSLTARTAEAEGARLFLSIHHDSVQPQYVPVADQFAGYSLFVSRKNVDPTGSLACARDIADELLALGRRPTLHHAEAIPGENRPLADVRRGIYWFDDLVVLRTAQQPAVLFEAGVIVNPNEEALLANDQSRKAIAGAVARGVTACLSNGAAKQT